MSRKAKGPKSHDFRNKLILNQWLISVLGIDPLSTQFSGSERPFHKLATPLKTPGSEGLDHDNLHRFYHALRNTEMFWDSRAHISLDDLLRYEQNISRHTQRINSKRDRKVTWKYYQWLTLLFVEIYLDKYFNDKNGLLQELNSFVKNFNQHWHDYADVPLYIEDDINKLCLQNATGSGKTLLMHVNLLQYQYYAKQSRQNRQLSRVILLTTNNDLSVQHIHEFHDSGINAQAFLENRSDLFSQPNHLEHVDVLEITSLADKEGPNTIATRSFGDQNLLLVDEGHRGMSGKEEGAWLKRRTDLCAKGFTFEYSATFQQAVSATKNDKIENSYAKSIIFDYSYRWFYEDGFGKDYQILNLPKTLDVTQKIYLTACLLKFYQQLRIYQEFEPTLHTFNLEKPLWVFVGSTVSKASGSKDEKRTASDVASIVLFIADFLSNPGTYQQHIHTILTGDGQNTGLLDKDGNDIFSGAFLYLSRQINDGETIAALYQDILHCLFNNPAGGHLELSRIKGTAGEVILRIGNQDAFGLINVGDAKDLCDHLESIAAEQHTRLTVTDSDFNEAQFATVKDSSSPINLLIGSKKFVEGWDCWRVSTMGLMHIGKTEGAQIIQLFGRGVRLKGWNWSLKRSGHSNVSHKPLYIEELETLNIFGIEADFMERFRNFLKEEGLPGNERRKIITIPLNVTYDFGKKLQILRPKIKAVDGREYDFKQDAAVPIIGNIPDYFQKNPVIIDLYPQIQTIQSRNHVEVTEKKPQHLTGLHCALLDYEALFFELEQFKRERAWYNLNISTDGIRGLLADNSWYILYASSNHLMPSDFAGILRLQHITLELLKKYCDRYYNYCKRAYIEPRLELRELTPADGNMPLDEEYQVIVDGNEEQLIEDIQRVKQLLETTNGSITPVRALAACNFGRHLYQPLLHVERKGKITVLPVALKDSELQFVEDLMQWMDSHQQALAEQGLEVYLLRNMSRGKGTGFFEAGNFYPDFILWVLTNEKQYVTFLDPHGLMHESENSEKIQFHQRIKEIEARIKTNRSFTDVSDFVLNSFILSYTPHPKLNWGIPRENLEQQHVLFMTDNRDGYLDKLFGKILLEHEVI